MKNNCCSCKNEQKLAETVAFLKAISDKNRLEIICLLKENEKCVCEIVGFLEIPQNLVSHHLKVLRQKGLVVSRKEGLKVFYSLNHQNFARFLEFFNFLTYIK